jgi:hypothetical protein
MYPLGIQILTNTKENISKRLLKTSSNFNSSKVHNYHLVKVSQKKDFTVNFIISFFNPFSIFLNNLD